jgi:C1A family cysteine protease
MKAGKKFGICREDLWDYNINEFKEQPRPDCYVDAANRKIIAYKSIQSVTDIIDSLNYGVPVVIALEIFKGFMSLDAKNPTIPIPSVTEDAIGGHAVTIVGYSETNQHFIFKNSFGTDWGLDGYGYMTLEYVRLYVFEKWAFSITNPFDPCLNERPPDPL